MMEEENPKQRKGVTTTKTKGIAGLLGDEEGDAAPMTRLAK